MGNGNVSQKYGYFFNYWYYWNEVRGSGISPSAIKRTCFTAVRRDHDCSVGWILHPEAQHNKTKSMPISRKHFPPILSLEIWRWKIGVEIASAFPLLSGSFDYSRSWTVLTHWHYLLQVKRLWGWVSANFRLGDGNCQALSTGPWSPCSTRKILISDFLIWIASCAILGWNNKLHNCLQTQEFRMVSMVSRN